MNHIVSGNLSHIPEQRACRLVPLKKKGTVDGVRPIAVGEVWLRLAAICAMEACPTKGSSMLPHQFGVGGAGGAQCVGHAVKAGILAHPEHVTTQVDFKKNVQLAVPCIHAQCSPQACTMLSQIRCVYVLSAQ